MELEATWGRVVRVWWHYVWVCLIFSLLAGMLNAGVFFVIDMVLGDAPKEVITAIAKFAFFIIGLLCMMFPFFFIIGSEYKGFRLVLLSTEEAPEPAADQQA